MRVANIMLNKAPTSNDATHIANNVRLTIVGAQQFAIAAPQLSSCRKADLPEMKDNDMITRKVRADKNEPYAGKERMEAIICLVGQAIGTIVWAGRQASSEQAR